jgi:hypothetical protein
MNRISFPQSVRLLSWIGDLLLVSGAIGLLIAHGRDLTPGFAAVLVLAVFLGGLLPVSVLFVEYLQQRSAQRSAEVSAPETLRNALGQLDRLVTRVETAAADAAKTTLAARQVPGLMQEGSDALQGHLGRLEALLRALGKLPDAATLAALAEARPAPPLDLAPLQDAIARLQLPVPAAPPDLAPLEQKLEALRGDLENALLVREDKLEAIVEQLASLEEMIADAPEARPTAEDEEEAPETAPPEAAPPAEAEEPTAKPAPPKKVAKRKKVAPVPAAEPGLFGEAPPAGLPGGQATLHVKALVGVDNRVYARGDPPLRWDHGRPLEATGIGEWRLAFTELDAPIEIELRLNDQVAAKGAPLTLMPGQVAHAAPQFPPANQPF